MSLWSTISSNIKRMVQGMIGARTIEGALHIAPVISARMQNAIQLWTAMYKNEATWLHEPDAVNPVRVVSLGLPALIASEKARTALLEFNSEITVPTEEKEVDNPDYQEPQPDELGNVLPSAVPKTITKDVPTTNAARAEFLEKQYKKLKKQLRKQIEYGIAKGGLVIKPYIVKNEAKDAETTMDIEFDFIQADSFYPLAFSASGEITEAAFVQTKFQDNFVYRRLEYHKWENNTVKVINKAYRTKDIENIKDARSQDFLGTPIELTDVPEWADLPAETTIKNVNKPLFAYFKMPEANTIDTTSALGVSGYSRAVQLIKDADMQYSRLLWEYEAGEMAIDIDRDALNFEDDGTGNGTGHSSLNKMQQRLFRKVDLGESNTFEPYAPVLRDTAYIQGLNSILMRIEDVTGLSRGTISDAAAEARTATELKILKQRSYQTNADIQQAIEDCLQDVIYIMNAYASLYKITPEGEYDVNFEWDDSIIVDVDMELNKRITLMQNGITSKLETRMWYFGETERQAKEALQQSDVEAQQQMKNDLAMQANQINMADTGEED